MQKPSKIILGIDPGTLIMGYSVIETQGNSIKVLEIDALKLPVKADNYERLRLIHHKVSELVQLHQPDELAIEAPFYGKNVQSMLKLGRAQGVAIAAALSRAIPVTEYSPKRIKQSITGNGNSDKEQVWKMLMQIVPLPEVPASYDASDALAVAITHHFSGGIPLKRSASATRKPASQWEKFAADNPGRVGG